MDILWLGEPECHDPHLVGSKAARLSRLADRQRVPPGFCLTSAAFVRNSVGSLTDDLRETIRSAYANLHNRADSEELAVAVRSSAVDEDGLSTSFAGQHQTYLNVNGVEAVTRAIDLCWASFTSEQVLDYRRQHGLTPSSKGVAVLVQKLIAADVSIVLFSANPVNKSRDEIMITATWGLGESLVGGTTTPDTWVISKTTRTVIEQQIGGKTRMTLPIPGGTQEVNVPRVLSQRLCLSDLQIGELVELGLTLENQMGWPVDLECAFLNDQLYLLQCRPITTLAHSVSA